MRIALIAPPFIEVPPRRYGGTELFIANLACELYQRGHDAARSADILHLNDIIGIPFTMFVGLPVALTIHHPHEPSLSEQYIRYPAIHYVTIARWLARREPMQHVHVVHHGIPLADYTFSDEKDDYVAFLGRMAPCKGPHLAIEAARIAGVRLKLAGEIQPLYQRYWEEQVLPHIDGDRVEYIGEADRAMKSELLARARALLFPIQWEEPFGLVIIEAMLSGVPVLGTARGAVPEILDVGTTGVVCDDPTE